ncbi:hypothetical protein FEDK69T_24740 [Flavobacterium enshiense DK69]|uniref:Uncharacterized protein n=1 Tax=Flavobacterium enshiense DK69 TaxID=1107311 RepID=V6S565_9FLAO|nr:hypothetical protein [Flavobacterium enshiense]ESU21407.1 hypothetical protein FEDK69T_24740 [Flavobacterium enshiense DK69]KGO97083.1 hypothetical protein Q767_00315 [Flavobacterium enshiense DK69]
MKKTPELKNILGLNQEEMGMLLGIHRTQWTMFKSGDRSLPLHAQQQFGALLQGTQNEKVSKEGQQLLKEEQHKAKEKLKREYQKVQIKLLRTEREIGIVENHRQECLVALKVVEFLANQEEYAVSPDLIKIIKTRATRTLSRHSLHKLELLQLQKETLEMLKLKMEKKLNL